jgi:hypothetical protein
MACVLQARHPRRGTPLKAATSEAMLGVLAWKELDPACSYPAGVRAALV